MIFGALSSRSFLREVFKEKAAVNASFSLRAMARQIGISPSTLSEILSGKKGLSVETAIRLAKWLKLNARQFEYLSCLAQLETCRSKAAREMLFAKLNEMRPRISQKEIDSVREAFGGVLVDSQINYTIPGTSSCRGLIFLKDKMTGKRIASFCDLFIDPQLFVSDLIFFRENKDGTFRALLNRTLSGTANLALIASQNKSLKVTFDDDGFPTVHRLTMYSAAKPKFALADLSFSSKRVLIEGNILEPKEPRDHYPIRIEYLRLMGSA